MFVDTNVFVYFLFDVDKGKQEACEKLFEKARAGKFRLWTTEWVIGELVWFLARKKKTWIEIQKTMTVFLSSSWLEVRWARRLVGAMAVAVGVDSFVDAINLDICREEEVAKGFSYDRGLDKFEGFGRVEP